MIDGPEPGPGVVLSGARITFWGGRTAGAGGSAAAEIAEELRLKESTVWNYLADALSAGRAFVSGLALYWHLAIQFSHWRVPSFAVIACKVTSAGCAHSSGPARGVHELRAGQCFLF